MSFKKTVLFASAFALSAFATPTPRCPDAVSNITALTADQLTAISSKTASCDDAEFPDECANATQAAIALNKAFETYQITASGEQAAIVAYELFESGSFKYKVNHFPGRAGQGTRMMAMPEIVKKYATAIAGPVAVAQAETAGGNASLNAVLALANDNDEKSFGSAAWFLSTQCSADVRAGLVSETEDGWHDFLTACVGTELDTSRDTLWVAATANIH
jgi:hypothetical protein